MNSSVHRVSDGFYHPIPPSEYLFWFKLTGKIAYPCDYDILHEMDVVFCEEANKELVAVREKRKEQIEKAAGK